MRKAALGVIALLTLYLIVAYVIVPLVWRSYAHRYPAWADAPRITHTGNDIPGDPINVALVGSEAEVKRILLAAGWHPADGLTFESCLEIAEASVLRRPYEDAPVSSLYLFGRKQDLAFEKPVGNSPRQRHHVRFWKWDRPYEDGRDVWFGSATFDDSVGLSHTTGQVTHHIAPDLDAERVLLIGDMERTNQLARTYTIDGFQSSREGKNGGGDPWRTDGNLAVAVIRPSTKKPGQ